MPVFSRADRCTYLLELGSPVDMKRGAGIRGAGIRGFAVIVVLKAGSSPPSFGVPALACLDLPLSDGGSRGVVAGVSARVGIFMGVVEGIPLGIFLEGGVFLLTIFLTLALDVVRDCDGLTCRLSGLDFGLNVLAEGPF